MRDSKVGVTLAGVALFIVLGGSAVAASGLIDGKKIKKGTVTARQIRNRTITKRKLAPATVASLKGRAGVPGEHGTDGEAGPTGATGPAGGFGLPSNVIGTTMALPADTLVEAV